MILEAIQTQSYVQLFDWQTDYGEILEFLWAVCAEVPSCINQMLELSPKVFSKSGAKSSQFALIRIVGYIFREKDILQTHGRSDCNFLWITPM